MSALIEPSELAISVQNPQWVIVDCRFDLTRPNWGRNAYADGHIPNAVYAHLDLDLSGPLTAQSGRHPLPEAAILAVTLGRLGIDRTIQVVAYDQGNGACAARLWWLLRWAGHPAVAVLNGGFAAWQQTGLPVTSAPPTIRSRSFALQPGGPGLVTTAGLERMIGENDLSEGRIALVDARGADRFAGENEMLDPVAGHVPGARNHPFSANLDAQGRFLPADQLRERWLTTLGHTSSADTVAMCGSGVTACHNLLALEVAGLPGARLYAGSWSEWIRDPSRPTARGPANDPVF